MALCSVFALLMPRDGNACTVPARLRSLPGPGAIRITASVMGYRDVDRPAQDVARAPGVRLRFHTALSGRTEETVVLLRLDADCSSLP